MKLYTLFSARAPGSPASSAGARVGVPAGAGRGRAGAEPRQKVRRNVGLDKFRMGIKTTTKKGWGKRRGSRRKTTGCEKIDFLKRTCTSKSEVY